MSLEVLVIIAAILRDAELKVVFVNKTDTFLSQKKNKEMCCFHEGGRLDDWLKLTFLSLALLFPH